MLGPAFVAGLAALVGIEAYQSRPEGLGSFAEWGRWIWYTRSQIPNAGPSPEPLPGDIAPPEPPLEPEPEPENPGPVPVPSAPAPAPAPVPTSAPKTVKYLGNPLAVRQGVTYRARLLLTGLEASLATPERVANKFTSELGFVNVSVWEHASDLPNDWPPAERGPEGKGRFFVQGLQAAGSADVARPEQIASVWEA